MARKAVCAAMPPSAFEMLSEAAPSVAAVTEVTVPESDVVTPRKTAPAMTSHEPAAIRQHVGAARERHAREADDECPKE